jgi:hypothetical protein
MAVMTEGWSSRNCCCFAGGCVVVDPDMTEAVADNGIWTLLIFLDAPNVSLDEVSLQKKQESYGHHIKKRKTRVGIGMFGR